MTYDTAQVIFSRKPEWGLTGTNTIIVIVVSVAVAAGIIIAAIIFVRMKMKKDEESNLKLSDFEEAGEFAMYLFSASIARKAGSLIGTFGVTDTSNSHMLALKGSASGHQAP